MKASKVELECLSVRIINYLQLYSSCYLSQSAEQIISMNVLYCLSVYTLIQKSCKLPDGLSESIENLSHRLSTSSIHFHIDFYFEGTTS